MKLTQTMIFAFVFVVLATSAFAGDARLREVHYDPSKITLVSGHSGIQTMVMFAENERIENIAVCDSAGWQVTPNRRANAVFVKPVMPGSLTNMTVVTDRRTYLFELSDKSSRMLRLYSLRFIYPPEPEPVMEIPAEAVKPVTTTTVLAHPTELNFAWTSKGKKSLLPARIFDDGRSTYLRWDDATPTPAIFALQPDGSESPVNQSMLDGYIVIDHVPTQLVLRLSKEHAQLTNTAPSKPVYDPINNAMVAGR